MHVTDDRHDRRQTDMPCHGALITSNVVKGTRFEDKDKHLQIGHRGSPRTRTFLATLLITLHPYQNQTILLLIHLVLD